MSKKLTKKVTYVKTSSLTRKLAQLAAAFLLIIVAISVWISVSKQGEALLSENAQVLARNILVQSSHSALLYIEKEDIRSLDQLTDSALQSDYIHEMIIYDHNGVVLSQSNNALSTKVRFTTKAKKDLAEFVPLPYVHEIKDQNDQLLGFIRVTVLTKKLQAKGNHFLDRISHQILLLLFLAAITGYLLTVGLRPFSSNAYFVKE